METGKKLKYDVKALRENPEKLTKAYQKNEEKEETRQQENKQEHEWKEWETYQKKLGKILEETYPLKKRDTEATEPKWTTLMENGEQKRRKKK